MRSLLKHPDYYKKSYYFFFTKYKNESGKSFGDQKNQKK